MSAVFGKLRQGMNRRKATPQGWRVLGRCIVGVMMALSVGLVAHRLMSQPGSSKLHEMQSELDRVHSEIAWRSEDVATRRLLVEALKSDPLTIEDFARDELFMVYPHEIILRLTESGETP